MKVSENFMVNSLNELTTNTNGGTLTKHPVSYRSYGGSWGHI